MIQQTLFQNLLEEDIEDFSQTPSTCSTISATALPGLEDSADEGTEALDAALLNGHKHPNSHPIAIQGSFFVCYNPPAFALFALPARALCAIDCVGFTNV